MDDLAYGKLDVPEMFNMMTPINSTHAFTFGMPRKNVSVVCLSQDQITFKGLEITGLSITSVFFLQLSMACFLTTMCKYLLKSFGQPPVVGQILAGIIAGPSFFGRSKLFERVMYPFKSLYLLDTISSVSCTLFLFIVGVKMDVHMIRRAGKKEWLIGFSSYIFPMLITIPVSSLLSASLNEVQDIKSQLNIIAFLHSCTAFHSVMCFLDDQNLLNSELGRLALSSSMISGFLSYLTLIISMEVKESLRSSDSGGTYFAIAFSGSALTAFTWIAIRPLTIWIIKNTPEGQPIKEIYPLSLVLLALLFSLLSEFLGLHSFYGPMVLGVVIPDGSVLATTLSEKFESFISFTLLPLYFLSNGIKTNLHMNLKSSLSISLIAFVGSSTKFLSTLLTSVFLCDIAARDAIVIGLILSTLGVLDVQYYQTAHQLGQYVSTKCFGVMNTSVASITALVSFLVKFLYDPSIRYIVYRRRTIQHALHDVEFRILVCIQDEEQVPKIIKLLEVSNPTRDYPISIYLFYLVELVGRYSPLLIAHENLDPHDFNNPIDRIIKAFRNFQNHKESSVLLQAFTAIAPFASMHDEICTLALDKRAALVILPFHKLWNDQGTTKETSRFRHVNRRVLKKAPCSVAIFIDRGIGEAPKCLLGNMTLFRVGLFFVGGADDREAIAYAMRMVRHADVVVTVIRCVPKEEEDNIDGYTEERDLDDASVKEFKICNIGCQRAFLKEQSVANGEEMFRIVRSEENSFDMIMVGRRHDKKSQILSGLTEWSEYPELGLMGDLLASNDFKGRASILVVQQHVFMENDQDPKGSRGSRAVLSHQDSFAACTASMTSAAISLNGSRKWC